jgi:hypothetical protein
MEQIATWEESGDLRLLRNARLMNRVVDLAAYYNMSPYRVIEIIRDGWLKGKEGLRKELGISWTLREYKNRRKEVMSAPGPQRAHLASHFNFYCEMILEKSTFAEGEYERRIW